MQDPTKAAAGGGAQILVRLYWMFFGNAVLGFLLVAFFEKNPAVPSPLDVVNWSVLISLIVVRFIDIAELNGETGDGKPATMAHWRRYVWFIAPVGSCAWVLTRALVHFLK